MLLTDLRLGMVEPGWTFVFQIVNTVIFILLIYLIYRIIKKVFANKNKLESRVNKVEDELKALKDKQWL